MLNRHTLQGSWRRWWNQDAPPVGPAWLQLLWTFLFCMAVALAFTVVGFAAFAKGPDAWRNGAGWWAAYKINLQVSLVIGYVIHALFALSLQLIGAPRIRRFRPATRTLYFSGVPLLGVAIGWPVGAWLTRGHNPAWDYLHSPNAVLASVLISLLLTLVFHFFFAAKSRQLQAEKRAAEAQLRLLQGQIEPHFLFNTLANVISLIDHDAPRAKQMLESFTDYLRSSLASLRHDEATLGNELDLAQHYLNLLKTRMEDRLQFSISQKPALREARLPPLLLQPLIENALHHGLEPKLDGGTVAVRARLEKDTLVLEVADDGLGLDAPPRRRGAGMALANLRARLLAQYGGAASLNLVAGHAGTVATLRLPFESTRKI